MIIVYKHNYYKQKKNDFIYYNFISIFNNCIFNKNRNELKTYY